ncbi:response regulator [Streptomyces sp. T1317-0309]|nr:response regulator [Streptomyces sp. T1317-0309]
MAREKRPDVVLLDIQLSEQRDGIDIAQDLRTELPRTRVVIMTGMAGTAGQVRRAQKAGASGFLPKTARPEVVPPQFAKSPRAAPPTIRISCRNPPLWGRARSLRGAPNPGGTGARGRYQAHRTNDGAVSGHRT